MHLFIKLPDIKFVPAIAKMAKKNKRMIIVLPSMGNACARAYTRTFKPLTEEIVLSGLKTLKDLKLLNENPASASAASRSSKRAGTLDMTITKSRIFHGSLRYAPLLNTNPRPNILIIISSE